MEIWTDSQMASIHKMLNPHSIAVIGATPRLQYGGRFLAAALKAKDRIRVYAVNPRYDEIMGIPSYASVTALPEAPDLVGIVVPYHQVLRTASYPASLAGGNGCCINTPPVVKPGAGLKPDKALPNHYFGESNAAWRSGPTARWHRYTRC